MVSCLSSAWAIATLVPTPSAELASSGLVVGLERAGVEEPGEAADAADHLGAAGLVDPDLHQLDGLVAGLDRDAGRLVRGPGRWLAHRARRRHGRSSASAAPPPVERGGQAVGVDQRRHLEQVLAEELRLGQLHRVDAVEARAAQVVGRHGRRLDRAARGRCRRASRRRSRRRSRRSTGRWRSARHGWRSRCRRSTATSPAGWRCARAPRGRRPRAASGPARAGCCRARSSRRRRPGACPRSRRAAGSA